MKKLKLKDLKPVTKQDKLFKSFIEHCRTYKIPERKYENMDKTTYNTSPQNANPKYRPFNWEFERWN